MKILFLTRRFYPDIGGVEKHVLNISERMIAAGHTIVIVAEHSSATNGEIYELYKSKNAGKKPKWQMRYISDKKTGKQKGVDISGQISSNSQFYDNSSQRTRKESYFRNLLFWKKYSGQFSPGTQSIIVYRLPKVNEGRTKKLHIWLWFIKHWYLLHTADVVHCHDVFFWYMPFRIIYWSKKVFITFHGFEGVFPPRKKAIIVRKLSELLANGNIIVGKYIEKWYKTKPTYIIYGAIDTSETGKKEKKILPKRPITIGFLGRLDYDTGVPVYLSALRVLKEKSIPFSFHAIGDGVLRKEVEKYGTASGFVSDVDTYLAKIDILFSSSYLSSMEAFLNKKYVISVYTNPMKEDILRMAPWHRWITITDNPDEIASVVDNFRRNRGIYDASISEAYDWVKKQTWEEITEIYIKLWTRKKRK